MKMKKIKNLLIQTASILLMLFVYSGYSQCTNSTTWNGSAWSNGAPNVTTNAIINGNLTTNFVDCCGLTVNNGFTLTIRKYCNVQGNITVNPTATLLVKADAKLVFTNTTTATGNVTIERDTNDMKQFDYTYCSSPVNTTVGGALLPTSWEPNWTFTFNTPTYYDVETTYMGTLLSNYPDGQDDNQNVWIHTSPTDTMVPGKGYASMILSIPATGTYPRVETVSFIGPLNTGNIGIPLELSENTSSDLDDFNLVGNPYPSAINSDQFIDNNIANISGTLYFWTHTDTMSSSYSGLAMYNFSTNDYAKYTKLGGVGAVFGGVTPTNVIGSCQGFLVEAESTNNLNFTPSLMSKAYDNTTGISFFKTSGNRISKNNLWLSMTDGGLYSQQLIGYNGSTDLDYNKGWDSRILNTKIALKFYSIEADIKYDIQARGQFEDDDLVHLGYFSAIDGTFTISIDKKQDNMKDQDVYLYDKSLDIWHDLSDPYTFSTIAGQFDNRFFIKYKNPEEDDEVHDYENHEDKISFNTKIEVYDMFNRHIQTIQGYNYEELPSGQILILKIYKDDGIETKKYFKQ
jgi:hypothetical protein